MSKIFFVVHGAGKKRSKVVIASSLMQKRAGQSCKSCKSCKSPKLFLIHWGGERTFVGLHAVAKMKKINKKLLINKKNPTKKTLLDTLGRRANLCRLIHAVAKRKNGANGKDKEFYQSIHWRA